MEPSSEPSSEKAYLSLGSTSLARAELARDMVVEGVGGDVSRCREDGGERD